MRAVAAQARKRAEGEVLMTKAWRERQAAQQQGGGAAATQQPQLVTLRVRFAEGVCLQVRALLGSGCVTICTARSRRSTLTQSPNLAPAGVFRRAGAGGGRVRLGHRGASLHGDDVRAHHALAQALAERRRHAGPPGPLARRRAQLSVRVCVCVGGASRGVHCPPCFPAAAFLSALCTRTHASFRRRSAAGTAHGQAARAPKESYRLVMLTLLLILLLLPLLLLVCRLVGAELQAFGSVPMLSDRMLALTQAE